MAAALAGVPLLPMLTACASRRQEIPEPPPRAGRIVELGEIASTSAKLLPRQGPAPSFAKVMDLEMLILTGSGRERTAPEYRALFGRAGFAVEREIPLPSLFTVFELTAG